MSMGKYWGLTIFPLIILYENKHESNYLDQYNSENGQLRSHFIWVLNSTLEWVLSSLTLKIL